MIAYQHVVIMGSWCLMHLNFSGRCLNQDIKVAMQEAFFLRTWAACTLKPHLRKTVQLVPLVSTSETFCFLAFISLLEHIPMRIWNFTENMMECSELVFSCDGAAALPGAVAGLRFLYSKSLLHHNFFNAVSHTMAAKYPGFWLCVNGVTHGNAHSAVWESVMKTWLQSPTHTSKLEKDGKKGRTTKDVLSAPWLLQFLYNIILCLCFWLTSSVCVLRDVAG